MGTCKALLNNGTEFTVADHLFGIASSVYHGASGQVVFNTDPNVDVRARLPDGLEFGLVNFHPPGRPERTVFTGRVSLTTGQFNASDNFIFANGLSSPPELLRDIPEQNYLSDNVRIAGFVLVGATIMLAILAMSWVFTKREHPVIRAAQPQFLYILCFGSIVMVCSIIPLSFDESHDTSVARMGKYCMSIPWLFGMGFMVTYGGLFMKLWRVNKVLQFTRRKVEIRHVAMPFIGIMVAGIIVLSAWTVFDPLRWNRKIIDDESGESIGQCQSDHFTEFLVPLILIMLIPVAMTSYMSYKVSRRIEQASGRLYSVRLLQDP